MTDNETSPAGTDLPVTLYLNDRLMFDIFAVLRDGYSSSTTVQTTSSEETGTEKSGGGGLNVGGLIGGGVERRKSQLGEISESRIQQLDQTPSSLFAFLRRDLMDQDIVKPISNEIRVGDFVEFESSLHVDSTVEQLLVMSELMPIFEKVIELQSQGASNRKDRKSKRNQSLQEKDMIESIISATKTGESQDLVASVGHYTIVIPTKNAYFFDSTMNDVIDGVFHVLGKVSRVIPKESNDSINLLRKSTLGRLSGSAPGLFGTPSTEQSTASGKKKAESIEVSGPALLVIPIAIFL